MPVVHLPDGSRATFPDDMPEADIAAAITRQYPQFAPKAGAAPATDPALTSSGDAMNPSFNPDGGPAGGVMEDYKPPAETDLPPVAGLSREKWAQVQRDERENPLDPNLLSIKPADITARAQVEAARLHHAGDDQFQRIADQAHLGRVAAAEDVKRHADDYSLEHLAGNTADNLQNVAAGVLKIGPTALKGLADIGRLASGDTVGKDTSAYLDDGMKTIDRMIASSQFNQNQAGFHEVMSDKNARVGDMLAYLVDHPQILLDNGITTVGSMFLPAGTAKLAVTGSAALGLGAKAAGAVATGAAMGTVSAQNAADTFTSDNLKDASLADRYRAATVSAAISLLAGIATHGGAEGEIARRMASELAAGRTTLETVKGFLRAFGNEAGQEMGEEFGNAAGEAVGSATPMDATSTAKRMAFAGIVGGIFGVATHASSAGERADARASAEAEAQAEAAKQDALKKWQTAGLTPSTAAASQALSTPATRAEPTWAEATGNAPAPLPAGPGRVEPTIGDIAKAPDVDSAIAAAMAVISKPVASPHATAAELDALEAAAAPQNAPQNIPEIIPGAQQAAELANQGKLQADGIDLTASAPNPDAVWTGATDAPTQATPVRDAIDRIIDNNVDWHAFPAETGTLGVPREAMPQIRAEHRGAMTQFLAARGITHEQVEVPAESLKPTQAEFSLDKVLKAKQFEGGNRSILVSSDGYVLDGHHQWLAAVDAGEPVKAIRLNAPIDTLMEQVKEFPSATVEAGATAQPAETAAADAVSQKPGAARIAAEQEKLRRQQEVVHQAAANLEKRKASGGERARTRVHESNPFLGFLATHGINLAERADTGAERGRAGNPMVPGFGPLFRRTGLHLDDLAEAARADGFLTQADIDSETDNGGTRKLAEMIARAVQAKEIIHPISTDGRMAPDADTMLHAEARHLGIETDGLSADQVYDAVVKAHAGREDHRQTVTGAATIDEQGQIEHFADQFTPQEAADLALLDDIPLEGEASGDLTDEEIDAIFGIKNTAEPAQAVGREAQDGTAEAAPQGAGRIEEPRAEVNAREVTDATASGEAGKPAGAGPESARSAAANDGIPVAFFKKVKVDTEVWIADEHATETVSVRADKAITSVREDIDNLRALLACMKG